MDPHAMRWPWYVSFGPAALMAGGIVWDLMTVPKSWGNGMLAASLVMAGALLSLRHTIAVATAIVLFQLTLMISGGYQYHAAGVYTLINTVFIVLIALGVNRVVARHGHRLEVVRNVAEAAQRAVLPTPPGGVGRLAIAADYKAAQVEALIGGDAYAVQDTPHGTRLMIADVRGKGMGAVGVVSVLLGTFRAEADLVPNLEVLAERLEHALIKEASQREEVVRMEGFVTALLGEITPDTDQVRLLNCGHPSPYLFEGDTVSSLDPDEPGLPLGMSGLGVPQARPKSWSFPAGGTLLLVTDGVTEARDPSGAFYEPVRRLSGQGPFRQPDEVIEVLVGDVEHWTGGPRDDDMAILAITRCGGEPNRP
ncbi:PP2C family protein-serine/threonine phosphatase [Streptomyces sp. NPDC090442]|uniref:PP2C family protein-serine/threonine phosphatase n=1 Tax=Streptomyces sp. NPDC090442 TaxID=3365962 RepID=UPI0037F90443